MPGIDGLELLKQIHSTRPDIPVIITTAHSDLDSAVAAYQGGAFEYSAESLLTWMSWSMSPVAV